MGNGRKFLWHWRCTKTPLSHKVCRGEEDWSGEMWGDTWGRRASWGWRTERERPTEGREETPEGWNHGETEWRDLKRIMEERPEEKEREKCWLLERSRDGEETLQLRWDGEHINRVPAELASLIITSVCVSVCVCVRVCCVCVCVFVFGRRRGEW